MNTVELDKISDSDLGQLLSYMAAYVARCLSENEGAIAQPILGIYLEGPRLDQFIA